MPEAEADWLRDTYEAASVILEYGSGGSTVLASEMPGKTIRSVENDWAWARMMRAWFESNPGRSRPEIVHVGIGPTKAWGRPRNYVRHAEFARYPLAVWDGPEAIQPDVVLIDGRFRVGCLLACVFRAKRPLTVLFDDYVEREHYHVCEDYAERVETRGRMARFEVTPRQIRNDELLEVIGLIQQPE
ncbi:hypothetical protein F3S47_08595 [Histidinibacterium aquaticum]|uniref:Class I SAM-dependent methyltransferase n=2 Tax=Histidinibacterium aquaticum TaxID=2613962 RepID=A0A5J5GPQ7_9RHOB|nr:hypothetical protein F3S47_08595 [Histidinibacterium aquaticum]